MADPQLIFQEDFEYDSGKKVIFSICESPVKSGNGKRYLDMSLDVVIPPKAKDANTTLLFSVESAISIRAVIDDFIERSSFAYDVEIK